MRQLPGPNVVPRLRFAQNRSSREYTTAIIDVRVDANSIRRQAGRQGVPRRVVKVWIFGKDASGWGRALSSSFRICIRSARKKRQQRQSH